MDWKTAQFMESRLGEEYEALIISVQKFGFFVELMEIFVEGLVGIDQLEEFTAGDACIASAITPSSASRSIMDAAAAALPRHRVSGSGDRVRVRAERIDPIPPARRVCAACA